MQMSFQCEAGYHILCRADRCGYCPCRCHQRSGETP